MTQLRDDHYLFFYRSFRDSSRKDIDDASHNENMYVMNVTSLGVQMT